VNTSFPKEVYVIELYKKGELVGYHNGKGWGNTKEINNAKIYASKRRVALAMSYHFKKPDYDGTVGIIGVYQLTRVGP